MVEYYNGEEVMQFISKCPVDGCTNTKDINWEHTGCSLKEYINDEGYIMCPNCNKKIHFFDDGFNCGFHENYKPPTRNSQRIIVSFALLGRLQSSGGKKFIRKLINSLIDQCDD